MSEEINRDAQGDLKICDAATPGPWFHIDDGKWCWVSSSILNSIKTVISGQAPSNDHQAQADTDFIAIAREALPYWINRAVKVEADLEAARAGNAMWLEKLLDKQEATIFAMMDMIKIGDMLADELEELEGITPLTKTALENVNAWRKSCADLKEKL